MKRHSFYSAFALRSITAFLPVAAHLTALAQSSTPCTITELPPNLQTGLAFYAPFCGNATDMGIGAHSGLVNGATLTTDRFQHADSAYAFNGTNSSINFGQVPEILGHDSLTICFWVNHQVHASYTHDVVMSNVGVNANLGCGYQCYILNATNTMKFEYRYSSSILTPHVISWNTPVTSNSWSFYTMTYRRVGIQGVVFLYLNGQANGSTTFSHPMEFTGVDQFRVGTNIDTTYQRFFKGNIDDIMIYDRVLTVAEIGQLYNGFIGPAGVNELDATHLIQVFPNPVTDLVTLSGPVDSKPEAITLSDACGRQILRTRPTQWPFALDMSALEPGCYMLSFGSGQARRLVKQ